MRSLKFYRFFYQSRYAEALATELKIERPFERKVLWAYYRLGMYRTIADCAAINYTDWKSVIAGAVSFAALGEHERAKDIITLGINRFQPNNIQRKKLVENLAAYHPTLALEIIDGCQDITELKLALLIKCKQIVQAKSLLASRITQTECNNESELCLLSSNINAGLPQNKLNDLNHYFSLLQLSGVSLINPLMPPTVNNIVSAGEHTPTCGPLVTILVTAYQAERYIKSAIVSLLNQSYRNIEILVINDGSDDDTEKTVLQLAQNDNRIKYFFLPRNIGTYAAKNIALQFAKGDFITCHDADDWAHPQKIEIQIKPLLVNQNIIATTSHWVRIDEQGNYYARLVYPLKRLNPASVLFRRKIVLEQNGQWDWVRTGADSEFTARLRLRFGHSAIQHIKLPLTLGAHRPDSLMTSVETGYCQKGVSLTRLEYWETWNNWHIEQIRLKNKPYLSDDVLYSRPFPVPKSVQVNVEDVLYCLNYLGISSNSFMAER